MKTEVLEVNNTKDLSIFKILENNRPVNNAHVANLVEAIVINPGLTKLSPIVVNEKMEVIDGQHRLAAHRVLEAKGPSHPIYYIVRKGMTVDSAKEINTLSRPWVGLDFARVEAGRNVNYKIYLDFYKETLLPHPVLVMYLTSGNRSKGSLKAFRRGQFVVHSFVEAEKNLGYLREITDVLVSEGFGGEKMWKGKAFGVAVYNVVTCSNYNHDWMLQMLRTRGDALHSSKVSVTAYEEVLRSIYNRGAAKRLRK